VFRYSFPVVLSGLALSFVATGCGSDDSSSDSDAGDNNGGTSNNGTNSNGATNSNGDTNNNGETNGGTGGGDEVVGRFVIQLKPPSDDGEGNVVPGFTEVRGKVYDGPVPEEVVWTTISEADGCTLLKPKAPFCETSCGIDVCVADDKCLPNPSSKNVGDVSLEGLTQAVMLKNIANSYLAPAGVTLPYPAFEEGDEIKVTATGGEYDSFEVVGKGIAPLELSDAPLSLDPAMPLNLTWTPPGQAGISRIHVKVDVSHHGGIKGKIECDVEDTGSLSISATMIASLTALGVAGFPSVTVTRSSSATTAIAPGKVELYVVSETDRGVEIPGLTSCMETADCPDGQTCQPDLTCK
jgi:hypothetical protein